MSISHDPVFAQTPKIALAASAAANANLNGTGTIIPLGTMGADGGLITGLKVWHTIANVAASRINFFVSLDNGTSWKLWESILLALYTPVAATSIGTAAVLIDPTNPDAARRLPGGAGAAAVKLGFASMDTEDVVAVLEWMDF